MNSLTMFLQSAVVEHLGWILMHSLWQFMFIAVAYFLVRQLLQNRSATVRYLSGCTAMLAMAAAPLVTAAVMDVALPEIIPVNPGGVGVLPSVPAAEEGSLLVHVVDGKNVEAHILALLRVSRELSDID